MGSEGGVAIDRPILAADGGQRRAARFDPGPVRPYPRQPMSPATDRPDLGFRWLGREAGGRGCPLTVEIPPESPAFRGHFPGRPILPAVAQLALVEQGLARLADADGEAPPAIVEVSGLRLRRTVGPGERLTLEFQSMGEAGAHRFEIRSDGGTVSAGTVRTATGDPGGEPSNSIPGSDPVASPQEPALGRVPHAPPALLVERLVSRSDSGARGRALIPADSPFAVEGAAPSYLGLEIAAQTAALVEALDRAEEAAAPRVGYLVAIRRARCYVRNLPVGEPLDVVVGFSGSAPPLSIYEIRIEWEGRTMVEGTISTWIAAEAAEGQA